MAQTGGGTQAVERAAGLVDLIVRADDPVSFTEVCDETGLARSTTSRLLAALERTDLVERNSTGGYVAGPLFALHAAVHDPATQLARLALPVMETVGEQTGESVHLAVVRGHELFHVAQVDSTYLLAARDWNQVGVPPHCSSLGKVLYAYGALPLPKGRLERRTPRTVGSSDALEAQLDQIRREGVATSLDELETGLTAVAVPLHGRQTVIAAIGVSGPTARLQDRVDKVGRLLVEAADTLSQRLLSRRSPSHQEGTA